MASEQTIEKFRDVVKKEYGVDLTLKEASEILHNWMAYFDLLAKIHHRSQLRKSASVSISPVETE